MNRIFGKMIEDLLKEIDDDYQEPKNCPWYSKKCVGFCQIDGLPCPYSKQTVEMCPKHEAASRNPEGVNLVLDK